MTANEISKIVFEAGLKIHRKIGPGLLKALMNNVLFMNWKVKD